MLLAISLIALPYFALLTFVMSSCFIHLLHINYLQGERVVNHKKLKSHKTLRVLWAGYISSLTKQRNVIYGCLTGSYFFMCIAFDSEIDTAMKMTLCAY